MDILLATDISITINFCHVKETFQWCRTPRQNTRYRWLWQNRAGKMMYLFFNQHSTARVWVLRSIMFISLWTDYLLNYSHTLIFCIKSEVFSVSGCLFFNLQEYLRALLYKWQQSISSLELLLLFFFLLLITFQLRFHSVTYPHSFKSERILSHSCTCDLIWVTRTTFRKVVASCAQAMGMHVIGYDPVMTPDAFDEVRTNLCEGNVIICWAKWTKLSRSIKMIGSVWGRGPGSEF